MRDRQSINQNILLPLFICLNKYLSHCLLQSVDFRDQFFSYLRSFLDLMKTLNFNDQYVKFLDTEQT